MTTYIRYPATGGDSVVTSVTDSNSIDLTITDHDLTADLKLSSAAAGAGNFKITNSIESDGLLSQAPIATTVLTGFLSSTDWNTFNGKLGTSLASANLFIGSAGGVATAQAITGDIAISNTGVTSIAPGVIVNADVNASAAIDGTKISPNFGSQAVSTTGTLAAGATSINGSLNVLANNELRLQDTTGGEYFGIKSAGTQTSYTITAPGSAPAVNNILRADPSTATTMVWTDGLATSTLNGFVNYRQTTTVDLTGSGSFTGGTLRVSRVDNLIIVVATVLPTFSSASAVSSASGVIPSWARPPTDILGGTFSNGSRMEWCGVSAAGLFDWRAFDYAGAGVNRTAAAAVSLSYSI